MFPETAIFLSLNVWSPPSPHYQKDKELLERVHHRFTRMVEGFSSLPYADQETLEVGFEERRNRYDLIEVFKMFYGYIEIEIRILFTLDGNDKDLRDVVATVRKFVNQDITRILGNIFLKSSH